MEKCIYTHVELNDVNPPNGQTATLEHILPVALGGINAFAINYCSKQANNQFGTDIDAPFIELPLVGMKRHQYGIKGHSGTVPPLKFNGHCIELNKPCGIIFPYNGAPYADFGIEVSGGIDEKQIEFQGGKDRVFAAAEKLLNKAEKRGLNVIDSDLNKVRNVSDFINTAVTSHGQTLNFRLVFNNETFFVPWSKGIIKMTLGLGALTLGKSWAFSPEADKLRHALLLPIDNFTSEINVKGNPAMKIDENLSNLLGIEAGKHTFAVLPQEGRMVAVISLFGGLLFDSIIDLGNGPADVRQVNQTMPKDWRCVYSIDPQTRKMTTKTINELNESLNSQG